MATKFRVEITRSAQRDVEAIWGYISSDSPLRAEKFISTLASQAATLERFPLRCPLIPENEILGTSYRHLIHGNYRTIFRIQEKTVFVMRIVHGSQLLDSSVFEAQT